MPNNQINTIDAKENFTDLISRVSHHKESIILTRRGKEIAAIIPIEDYLHLQIARNKSDLDDATEALKEARENGVISLENLIDNMD